MNPPTEGLPPALVSRLQVQLLEWFDRNRRDLPWRSRPSPYRVWVSEVMLQQTRVDVVKDYFERWMSRFPSVESLARANDEEVLHLWQGLGYYSRARRLLDGARYLVREMGGHLPSQTQELLKVPGVGPYSAGAIASIAHGVRTPLVDGNVIRVLTRAFALAGDPNKNPLKGRLWEIAGQLVPAARPGDFNQALMELGALVCTPKGPSCVVCPWRADCLAFRSGTALRYPEKPKAAAPTEVRVLVLLARHRGAAAVERLPADARWWAGMSAWPTIELGSATSGALSAFWKQRAAELEVAQGLPSEGAELERFALDLVGASGVRAARLPSFIHQVTRFKIRVHPLLIDLGGRRPSWPGHVWAKPGELVEHALPAPHRKLISALLGAG